MAVEYVDFDIVGADNSSGLTRSRTIPSGTDQVLVVFLSSEDSDNATHGNIENATTYNGVTLTPITNGGGGFSNGSEVKVFAWYMVNPPVGTANIVVDLIGTVNGINLTSVVLRNVDTTNPIADFDSNTFTASGSSSVSLDCVADSLLLGYIGISTASTFTPSGGQTSISSNNSNGYWKESAYKTIASAGSNSLGWTFSTSRGCLIAVNFQPVVEASGGGNFFQMF